MSTITVLKFESDKGAEAALATLVDLSKQHLITIVDAAIVTWPKGKKKPKTRQAMNLTAAGALDGTFWGMLFGLIFFMPFMGAAIGAASGAIAGALSDFGINDGFIKDVRAKVTEGTSCLFLMSTDETPDRVVEGMKAHNPEVISTNLSVEKEQALKDAFAEEAV